MAEELGEDFGVHLIEAFEGGVEDGTVFSGGGADQIAETVGGMMHQQFGILEALGVLGEAEVDELRVVFDPFEGCGGCFGVAVCDLFGGHFGHGVDQLGVEEALVAGTGLLGAEFELAEGLGVGEGFVDGGGVDGNADHEKKW